MLRRCNGRHGIRPAGVEGEMRDGLRDLARRDAVVERDVEVVRHLDRLIARDERGERHDAAVTWRKTGPLPYLAQQTVLRVLFERRRDHADFSKREHW